MTEKTVKVWTKKAPPWDQIVQHYRAHPGLIVWLSNRHPVMRGEVEDVPLPTGEIEQEEHGFEKVA